MIIRTGILICKLLYALFFSYQTKRLQVISQLIEKTVVLKDKDKNERYTN